MSWYPECAATPETDLPTNFEPPTIGRFLESEKKIKEGRLQEPPESMESPVEKGGGHRAVAKIVRMHGKPHFKLGGKMYAIDGNTVVEDPDMDLQSSKFGYSSKENPIPGIPKKSEQPSEDIRQKKPLARLRQREAGYVAPRYKKSHSEGDFYNSRYEKSHGGSKSTLESSRLRESVGWSNNGLVFIPPRAELQKEPVSGIEIKEF